MSARPFDLGRTLITPNARDRLDPLDVLRALSRHTACDWGELDHDDRLANQQALATGGRLFSVYRDRHQTRFYIITEADRSTTTILLPEDY